MFTTYHSSTVRLVILHLVVAFPHRQGLFGIASASVFRNLQDTKGMTSAEMWVALKTYPIYSMVLVYLPTKLGDFVWANVGK